MGGIRQRDRTDTPICLQSASISQAGSRDGTDLPTVRLLLVGSPVNEKDITWGEFGWGRHLIGWVWSVPGFNKHGFPSRQFPAAH